MRQDQKRTMEILDGTDAYRCTVGYDLEHHAPPRNEAFQNESGAATTNSNSVDIEEKSDGVGDNDNPHSPKAQVDVVQPTAK